MIVTDIETTGLDERACAVASIGAVDFDMPENQFYIECQVPQIAQVNDAALEINGFTREQLFNPQKPEIKKALEKFFAWASNGIADMTLGGENIRFDMNFLAYASKLNNLAWPFGYRTTDLHTLSMDMHDRIHVQRPLKNKLSYLSLDETLKFVGLFEEPKPHNALTGAKMEAEAFSRLKYGRPLFPEFEKYTVPAMFKR